MSCPLLKIKSSLWKTNCPQTFKLQRTVWINPNSAELGCLKVSGVSISIQFSSFMSSFPRTDKLNVLHRHWACFHHFLMRQRDLFCFCVVFVFVCFTSDTLPTWYLRMSPDHLGIWGLLLHSGFPYPVPLVSDMPANVPTYPLTSLTLHHTGKAESGLSWLVLGVCPDAHTPQPATIIAHRLPPGSCLSHLPILTVRSSYSCFLGFVLLLRS